MNKLFNLGFTLIELMITVVIMSILATIAVISYQSYTRQANASTAQQEMLKLSSSLERHRARNFTYKGFKVEDYYPVGADASTQEISMPLGAANVKYTITVVDGAGTHPLLTSNDSGGKSWAIKAKSNDVLNDSFLLTSNGIKCKNLTESIITYESCGTDANGSKVW